MKIPVGGQVIPCHRCILGTQWPFLVEVASEKNLLSAIPSGTLRKLIAFMYNRDAFGEFNAADCLWISSFAEQYKITNQPLFNFAYRFLTEEIQTLDPLEVLKMGMQFQNQRLMEKGMDMVPADVPLKKVMDFFLEVFDKQKTDITALETHNLELLHILNQQQQKTLAQDKTLTTLLSKLQT
eukprot:TRINITY_DN17697_c0_g1_i1.p2 TRINITY_DN17697_c0_g1~~TRINITY_DN17697_c0_g1_i1.p2  ORF type:complete len:182 (+),score=42.55 TRINITY_DN17697_c0_g1_i1:1352-1897(+)